MKDKIICFRLDPKTKLGLNNLCIKLNLLLGEEISISETIRKAIIIANSFNVEELKQIKSSNNLKN